MKKSKISMLSRAIFLIASALLLSSIFFPLWRIELTAPQYPEGLVLQLHADKIGGDVDIINGLNHYIGMKTLHAENFFEFSVLKYIFIAFAVFGVFFTFLGSKKGLYFYFISFVLFIIASASDFYRWNYNYGHDLNPNAAIKVPGMAYQPPLLGYKQLLNFGAYSIPDIGGFILIGAGILLFIAVVKETEFLNRFKKTNLNAVIIILFALTAFSCNSKEPKPIKLNYDTCDFCKMTISNAKYASELITKKGRCYKFDDVSCMIKYLKDNSDLANAELFVTNYSNENQFIPVTKGFYLLGGTVRGPMGGKVVAFDSDKKAANFQTQLGAEKTTWKTIYTTY